MTEKYDKRNKLNDLTGKEWLKLTKSFRASEKCADDLDAFEHPAPFLIKDIEKLINFFTKKDMTVLDPFVGSGTTLIAANNAGRKSIGVDLSQNYYKLAQRRLKKKKIGQDARTQYIVGDALEEVPKLNICHYVVTSPPYHNILQNKNNGIRKDNSNKGFRSGSRIGVEYYSDMPNDLGNQESYETFISLFKDIMKQCFLILAPTKYCSIVMSDFTVNRKEVCVQSDIVRLMLEIGFEFVGTIILLQDNKPLYPFGYPFAFKINHMHQNIINFRKME